MEDLKLITGNSNSWNLQIEPLDSGKAFITIEHYRDEAFYILDKEEAKQIVEHLTKVFEL